MAIPARALPLTPRNTLLRTGIGHVLSGSRFLLAGEPLNKLSDLLALAGPEPALALLRENLALDTCVVTLETLTNALPSLRTVILADDLTLHDIGRLCQAGLGGICPIGMSQSAFLKTQEFVMLGETFLPASMSFELLKQGSGQHPWAGVLAQAEAAAVKTRKLSARDPGPEVSHPRRLQQAHCPGAWAFGSHRDGSCQGDPAQD